MNMRRSRIRILLLTLLFMLAFVLVACGGDDESVDNGEADDGNTEEVEDTDDGDDDADEADGNDEELFDIEDFPTRSEEGEVEEGGTLNFGLISDTAFEGLLKDRKSTRLNSS